MLKNGSKGLERQGSIPVWCVHSLLALTIHQMSVPVWGSSSEQVGTGLQSWPPDVTSKGCGRVLLGPCTEGEPGPGSCSWELCTVKSNASWVMVTWEPHPCGWTDWQTRTTENITFPQLRWWAVMSRNIIIVIFLCSRYSRFYYGQYPIFHPKNEYVGCIPELKLNPETLPLSKAFRIH